MAADYALKTQDSRLKTQDSGLRTHDSGIMLHQLDQDAHAARVNERDEAMRAAAGLRVDQLGSGGRQPAELGADVADLEGQMVQPFATPRQKARDRRILRLGLDQLDRGISEPEEGDLYLLVGDAEPLHECWRHQAGVSGQRGIEVGDRDAGVVNAAEAHMPISSRRISSASPASMEDSAPALRDATPSVMPSRQRPVVRSYIAVRASLRP